MGSRIVGVVVCPLVLLELRVGNCGIVTVVTESVTGFVTSFESPANGRMSRVLHVR